MSRAKRLGRDGLPRQTSAEFRAEIRGMLARARESVAAAARRERLLQMVVDDEIELRPVKVRAYSVRAYSVGEHTRYLFGPRRIP